MDAQADSWLYHFEAFSTFHAVTLLACGIAISGACLIGRTLQAHDDRDGGGRERAFVLVVAIGMCAFQAFATGWRFLPSQFSIDESLPLHLCRVVGWVAPFALLTRGHRSRAVLFFWGLGLSTQGYITPVWTDGLLSVGFWVFWVGHTVIIGAAIYDLAVRGYNPVGRDFRFASGSGLGFATLVVGVNLALGTNYCYLGQTDYGGRTVVDMLGDWPLRMIPMVLGALFLFGMLYGLSMSARWAIALPARLRLARAVEEQMPDIVVAERAGKLVLGDRQVSPDRGPLVPAAEQGEPEPARRAA